MANEIPAQDKFPCWENMFIDQRAALRSFIDTRRRIGSWMVRAA
jgi:hypothetical protein